MAICEECSINFFFLSDKKPCNKCVDLEGKSEVEKSFIRSKGQCKTCGLVYGQLQEPLCMACCIHFKAMGSLVPVEVLDLCDVPEQLEKFQKSDFIYDILDNAEIYKRHASSHRLGLPRTQNASLVKAGSSRSSIFTKPAAGIAKGQSILQDIKALREEHTNIKIAGCLWYIKMSKKGINTLVKNPEISLRSKFRDAELIRDALSSLLIDAREFHKKSHPLAREIQRHMISFYAHETATKATRIPERFMAEGVTVVDFLQHFVGQGWMTPKAAESRSIEIRLTCNENDLFPPADLDIIDVDADISIVEKQSSKRRLSSTSEGPRQSNARNIRRSAWRTAPVVQSKAFSRNPSLTTCSFARFDHTVSNGTDIRLSSSAIIESIMIATTWAPGSPGFIGEGSAKTVIYARIGDQEYALGQSSGDSFDENSRMLEEEFKNLVYGEIFRKDFLALASETRTPLPDFRFNFEGAILGTLIIEEGGSLPCSLQFSKFIATPMLPCGTIDAPVQKFTGNDDVGEPPKRGEDLTMALHAFTHFMIVSTLNNLVLCDLQGLYDVQGVMCLIDPQSHSSNPSADDRIYWDQGSKAIEHILTHHLKYCSKNKICSSLDLQHIEYKGDDASSCGQPSPKKPRVDRSSRKNAAGILRVGF